MSRDLQTCMQACSACEDSCREALADAAVAGGLDPGLARLLRCSMELCAMCAELCLKDAGECVDAFDACAEACRRCAAACERSGDLRLRQCLADCVWAAFRCRRCVSVAA